MVDQVDDNLDPAVRDFDSSLRTLRSDFLNGLSTYLTEEFSCTSENGETPSNCTPSFSMSIFGNASTINSDDGLLVNTIGAGGSNFLGRFDTSSNPPATGTWFETSNKVEIKLKTPSNAFGLYLLDLGDFDGVVAITLTDTEKLESKTINTDIGDPASGEGDANILFYGVYTDGLFDQVTLSLTQAHCPEQEECPVDVVGLDSLVYGLQKTPDGNVSEPASIALVGLALIGGALARRRRR